jgi:hypothetical protein
MTEFHEMNEQEQDQLFREITELPEQEWNHKVHDQLLSAYFWAADLLERERGVSRRDAARAVRTARHPAEPLPPGRWRCLSPGTITPTGRRIST